MNGTLQILQTSGQPDQLALYAIQRRYGQPEWTPVRAEFIEKNTDHTQHAPIRDIQAFHPWVSGCGLGTSAGDFP